MGYNLVINGIYWGYNPLILTFDPNFQRDILVGIISTRKIQVSNEKALVGCLIYGIIPVKWGLFHKPRNKDPYETSRIQWKVRDPY